MDCERITALACFRQIEAVQDKCMNEFVDEQLLQIAASAVKSDIDMISDRVDSNSTLITFPTSKLIAFQLSKLFIKFYELLVGRLSTLLHMCVMVHGNKLLYTSAPTQS